MRKSLISTGEGTAYLVAREEYRAEVRISLFRSAFILILLTSNVIQAILLNVNLTIEVLPAGILFLLSLFLLIDIWWIGRSRHFDRFYRPGHKFLIISLDVIGFCALLYLTLRNPGISTRLNNFGLGTDLLLSVGGIAIFGLYILLNILRFSPASTWYAFALFTLGFVAVQLLLHQAVPRMEELGELMVPFFLFIFPSLVMTFLASFVSGRIARMVVDSKIQQQLERYLPPVLTRESRNLEEVQLDAHTGNKGPAAILFSDIRDFTGHSEKMSPQEVVEFLNSYFSQMIDSVFSNQGTLDKLVGDEIMALFGTPRFSDDYCSRALQSALDMLHRLEEFNATRRVEGLSAISIGIGIHEGEVVFGNIGSQQRMDFTAIGDAVNTASRLERLTRKLNQEILISEQVLGKISKKLRKRIVVNNLGAASVRGKNEKIVVYSVKEKR